MLYIILIYLVLVSIVLFRGIMGPDWFDIITRGYYNEAKNSLILMVRHLQMKREEWKINDDGMQYPKEGAYKVLFSKDRQSGKWSYSLNGNGMKPLIGHYASIVEDELKRTMKVREFDSVVRVLYPDAANLRLEVFGR